MSPLEQWERDEDTAAEDQARRLEKIVCNGCTRLDGRLRKLCAGVKVTGDELLTSAAGIDRLQADILAARWSVCELTAMALHDTYTAEDVSAWCQRAVGMGCQHPRIRRSQLLELCRHEAVPNHPFRVRLQQLIARESVTPLVRRFHERLCAMEGATGRNLGSRSLLKPNGSGVYADVTRVRRLLGMDTMPGRHNQRYIRMFIPYEVGVCLAAALGMSNHDAGV